MHLVFLTLRRDPAQRSHLPALCTALMQIKTNIRQEIQRIPLEMCARVIQNFNVRVATVIQRRGAWIEHVINY